MNYIKYYDSPIGPMTAASDGQNLTALCFNDQKSYHIHISTDSVRKDLQVFDITFKWLDLYFKGQKPDFTPDMSISGSRFSCSVYSALKTVPYGKTESYGQIAAKIAKKRNQNRISAQAVGTALGRNPVLIIIPCHRIISAKGDLSGYAGGIEKKKYLLNLEGSEL